MCARETIAPSKLLWPSIQPQVGVYQETVTDTLVDTVDGVWVRAAALRQYKGPVVEGGTFLT